MRISDWSSDVCSSDLLPTVWRRQLAVVGELRVSAGRTVFFISSRGFCSITDGAINLIGANRTDTTFFSHYSTADIESSVTAAIDPIRKLVIWAMPRRLWCYNWELDRWADIEVDAFAVSTGATQRYTLEQIDVLYPGGLEAIPCSLDDPIFLGGEPFLMIVAEIGRAHV